MTAPLLDANVLIALVIAEHEHHEVASRWLGASEFVVCPVVEGALVRFLLRLGENGATAALVLDRLRSHPSYQFAPDSVSYADLPLADLQGHKQVTDEYLVGLARSLGTRLATFDHALSQRHPSVGFLPR